MDGPRFRVLLRGGSPDAFSVTTRGGYRQTVEVAPSLATSSACPDDGTTLADSGSPGERRASRARACVMEAVRRPPNHGETHDEASRRLREVFVAHGDYVWNSLRRLGVAPCDLEDVTHDVFVQIQSHLPDYDPARPLRPWLFGFAFRVASAHRRRAHRRREVVVEAPEATDPRELPDEALAAEDDRRLVLAALESIPMERRAVFVLYELDGVEMDTIAKTLSIPVNTAYSRLRTARSEFVAAVHRLRARSRTLAPLGTLRGRS